MSDPEWDAEVEKGLAEAKSRTGREWRDAAEVGIKHDDGKPRFDLIPPVPLTMLADLYRIGAAKYTKYGECTCGAAQSVTRSSTPVGSADRITSETCDSEIPTSPSASVTIGVTGENATPTKSGSLPSVGQRPSEGSVEPIVPTDSPASSTRTSSLGHADSAGRPSGNDTSTTITTPERSAARSATVATLASGSSRSEETSGSIEHSPGCGALRVVRDGARNWEKGIAFSRLFAALQRHAWAWWSGEEHDPVDRQHHLSSVAWCAFAIMELQRTKPEFDDRPGEG